MFTSHELVEFSNAVMVECSLLNPSFGNTPELIILLNKIVRDLHTTGAAILSNLAGIPSKPVALFEDNFMRTFSTMDGSIVENSKVVEELQM